MKQTSLIVNIVLGLAVIGLYVLHFTSGKTTVSEANSNVSAVVPAGENQIVYINIDSVLAGYNMYFDIQGQLEEKLKTSEAKLASQQNTFQKKAQDFQYKIERGLITRSEAGELQQKLMAEEQDLMQLQNNLRMQLAEEEQVAQRKVLNSIMEYLKSIEGETGYQFVLGTSFGGNILYANENLDITKSVIAGLNEYYKNNQE